jgi:hypothetical protein
MLYRVLDDKKNVLKGDFSTYMEAREWWIKNTTLSKRDFNIADNLY